MATVSWNKSWPAVDKAQYVTDKILISQVLSICRTPNFQNLLMMVKDKDQTGF